jgi:hypothetical protein
MEEQYNKKGGPRTKAGRETSSRNSLKHGLSVDKLIIPGEDPTEFEALHAGFVEDFAPETTIEAVLVHDLAKYHWLKERAIRQQQLAFFTEQAIDPKHLALVIRYQTANERAFHATLKALQALQKQQEARERKSVSKTVYVPDFWRYDENGLPIPDPDDEAETQQNDPSPPRNTR